MKGLYYPVAQHLQQFCKGDEFVIWRDAFRWKNIKDEVLSNHYDCYSIETIADTFGYEIVWEYNLRHVAIVRKI